MSDAHAFDQLSVSQLRLFAAVYRLQSFTAAARELSLSQPAVSRAVAAMESALGGVLFLRTTRKVRPSALAESVFERLAPLLEGFDRLDLVTHAQTRGLAGRLRIAAPAAFGRRFVVPVATRFLAANPKATCELLFADRREDLVARGIDLAIRIGEARTGGARTRVVGSTRGVLVAAPALLEGRKLASLSDLAALPIVLPVEGGEALLKAASALTGRPISNVRLRADDVDVLRSAVVGAVGACVLPQWLVEEDLASGRLVAVRPSFPAPPLPIRLVFTATPSRLARAFSEAFAASLPDLLRRPSGAVANAS